MTRISIGQTDLTSSNLALGCMRLAKIDRQAVRELLATSLAEGINLFDHADIYGKGASETVFGQAVKDLGLARDRLIIQSKCGIRQGFFDFSKGHILTSVEESLQRLGTDYLDLLLLHRPDALMEPEEVAEAFYQLEKSGKVRHFGVSNHSPYQIYLLNRYLDKPLAVNQLQLSLAHTPMLDAGLNVNMTNPASQNRDFGVLDYCRLQNMTVQAWSPFQIDLGQGIFYGHADYQVLTQTIDAMADKYQVSPEAIMIAWILRHPARIQAVVGTTNPDRLRRISQANQFRLSREDWYALYRSAGNQLP